MVLKKGGILLVVLLVVSFIIADSKKSAEITINPSSKLTIQGITNIANFVCKFNSATLKGKIPITYDNTDGKITFENAILVLDNMEFDCGKKLINNDFRSLLKTETYPEIKITLKEIHRITSSSRKFNAIVDFKIAGVTKTYKVPIAVSREHTIKAQGGLKLNIRDFGLENPKKMFGLIKIEDVVTVNFNLDLEVL